MQLNHLVPRLHITIKGCCSKLGTKRYFWEHRTIKSDCIVANKFIMNKKKRLCNLILVLIKIDQHRIDQTNLKRLSIKKP